MCIFEHIYKIIVMWICRFSAHFVSNILFLKDGVKYCKNFSQYQLLRGKFVIKCIYKLLSIYMYKKQTITWYLDHY